MPRLMRSLAFSANAAKEMLLPYFPPIIESLKGFLTDTREEMRALQTQALGKNNDPSSIFCKHHASCTPFSLYIFHRHTFRVGPHCW